MAIGLEKVYPLSVIVSETYKNVLVFQPFGKINMVRS